MTPGGRLLTWRPWLGLLASAAIAGCLEGSKPAPSVPDHQASRKAVQAMIASWKAGRPAGVIEPGSPRLHVIDTSRIKGQTLDSYEILGETKSKNSRDVTIRVHLSHPDATKVMRYRVLGIDPIVVFNEEDYQLIAHWEHRMDDAEPAPDAPSPDAEK